jgi:hypothetical protein
LRKSIRLLPIAGVITVLAVLFTGTALAQNGYTLFGDAEIVSPGNDSPHAVEADGTTTGSGISFEIPAGTTFGDLDELSTDYLFTQGTCMAGSPRFQVRVQDPDDGDVFNIFVYIGPPPAYTPCPTPDYVNTGDLLEGVNPLDTSQDPDGGAFYDPYATAVLAYGEYEVLGVSLVVDPGYGQIVRFDNTVVDETLYTYDQPVTKDECKNGGWMDLTRADGSPFKNQGDCIQYVNTGK